MTEIRLSEAGFVPSNETTIWVGLCFELVSPVVPTFLFLNIPAPGKSSTATGRQPQKRAPGPTTLKPRTSCKRFLQIPS